MSQFGRSLKEGVAGGRLASSAQPPRATTPAAHRRLTQPASQPFRPISFLDTPVALLEGLRCFTAFRPLLRSRSEAKEKHWTFLYGRNQK